MEHDDESSSPQPQPPPTLYVYTSNHNTCAVPNLGWTSDEGSMSCCSVDDGDYDYYFNQPNHVHVVTPPRCYKLDGSPSPRTIIEPIYEEEEEDEDPIVKVDQNVNVDVDQNAGWICLDEMMQHVIELFYRDRSVKEEGESSNWMDGICGDVTIANDVTKDQGLYVDEKPVSMSVVKSEPMNRSAQPLKQRVAYLTDLHHEFYSSCDSLDLPEKRSRSIDEGDCPVHVCESQDEEELYYDSDPESYLYSTDEPLSSSVDNVTASLSCRQKPVAIDDEECLEFIKETTNRKMNIKSHTLNSSPSNMIAWIEHGTRFSGQIIQPCFFWRKPSHLKSSINNVSGSKPLRQQELSSIELLDIYRILKATEDIRKDHPLAKVNNCFVITTSNNKCFVFEAQSETERDIIVNGLKLLVSRLASMIIVGNNTVFAEFFNPRGSVPGAAPTIWDVSPPSSPVKTRDDVNFVDEDVEVPFESSSNDIELDEY